MNMQDILALARAGFSRDEINTMLQQGSSTPAPEPVPEPVPEPTPQPTPQPAPQPAQEPAQPTMSDIMNGIARLTSAVQANAIAQSVIPGAQQNAPTAEDMLAEIIRPTFKQRGD